MRIVIGVLFALLVLGVVLAVTHGRKAPKPADVSERFMPGVNLAGAGFYEVFMPDGTRARHGIDQAYVYPSSKYADGYRPHWFVEKGMPAIRLSFLWERLQQRPGGPLHGPELVRLKTTVEELTSKGAWVIIDLHNYFRYEGELIGSGKASVDDFVDVWRRIARVFKKNPNVSFGLMNEPYDVSTALWVDAANRAIRAIREEDSQHYILVGGNQFSAAQDWYVDQNGEANATAMLRIADPLDRVIFEAHTYFDHNSSGQHTECVNVNIGIERLRPFTKWLKENNKKGFLGEFGAAANPVCLAALANTAKYLLENRDVYIGWTYWAAGPKWPSDWPYLIEPTRYGEPNPQLRAMVPYIPGFAKTQ